MPTTPTEWLAILNLVLLVAVALGGVFAFRFGVANAERDVQNRVRDALSTENELLQARVNRLEKENRHFERVLDLIILTLKKTHAIELEIDNDIITLRDPSGKHIARVDTNDLTA